MEHCDGAGVGIRDVDQAARFIDRHAVVVAGQREVRGCTGPGVDDLGVAVGRGATAEVRQVSPRVDSHGEERAAGDGVGVDHCDRCT
jgi:hypothetical protein